MSARPSLVARLRNPGVAGWLLMVAAAAVAAALIAALQSGSFWGSDEFFWLELSGLGTPESFYHPYGGHLIVLPFFTYRGVLELWGASFTAYTVVQVSGLCATALLLYAYAKRRLGPLLALSPAIILLFLGSSWTVVLQPMIGIQFLTALIPAMGALLLIERRSLPADVAACALLCVALAGFTNAAAFVVGAALMILLAPNWAKRIWVVVIPILAYAYWRHWAAQFGSLPINNSDFIFLPASLVDSLAIAGSAIFGLATNLGPGQWTHLRLEGYDSTTFWVGIVVTIAELVAIGLAIWWMRRRGGIPRSLWPPLAILLTLWVETGVVLGPGRTPGELRYVYTGVLVLLMVICEVLRGTKATRKTLIIALLITGLAVGGNLFRFREGHRILTEYSREARAQNAILRLGAGKIDEAFTPNIDAADIVSGGFTLNQGPWLQVQERYGTQGDTIAQLRAESETVRAKADELAVRALRIEPVPAPRDSALEHCRTISGGAATLPRGGTLLRPQEGTKARLGRWADGYPADLGPLRAGRAVELRIPADAADQPWRLQLDPAVAARLCALPKGDGGGDGHSLKSPE